MKLASYCRLFRTVAARLLGKGALDNYGGTECFLQGLDEGTFKEVWTDCELDDTEPESFKLMAIIDRAAAIAQLEERWKSLRPDGLQKLVEAALYC